MFVVINGALQYVDDSVLTHHGVKGMKWGVRRYQNPDGSLTPAGQKRYASRIAKAAKGNSRDDRIKLTNDVAEDLLVNYRKNLGDKVSKLKNARDALEKAQLDEDEFYDSPARSKAWKSAYKSTLEWFEKNEPEELSLMVEKNGGKRTGLEKFHDFDTTLDGYADEAYAAARAKWNKSRGHDMEALKKDYNSACKEAVDTVLGKYGQQKITDTIGGSDTDIRRIVENAIVRIGDYEEYVQKRGGG